MTHRITGACLLVLSIGVAPEAATAQDYFEIRVTDAAGAPAPCVTLRTVNGVAQVSDDAGRVAFYEPGLMDTEVFFYVEGEGVLFPADGFGFAGTRLTVSEGGVGAIEVTTAPPCDGGDLATRRLARGVLAPEGYARVRVLDDGTERGVPLVELSLGDSVFVSDSAGWIAIDPLGLEGPQTGSLRSHGYTFDAPLELTVAAGAEATVRARRVNLAERLYRVTGGGIYRDSLLLGEPTPLARPAINGLVVGQDSVFSAVFRGELFLIWGDTLRPAYPLGNFHASGATAALPADGGLDPSVGIDLTYFVDAEGFSRAMAPPETVPGEGVTWLGTLVVVPDAGGEERLFATFAQVGPDFERYRFGLLAYDEANERFVDAVTYEGPDSLYPHEGAFVFAHGEQRYVYSHEPTRIPASAEALVDPATYESFTALSGGAVQRDAAGAALYAWRAGEPRVTAEDSLARSERLFGHFVDAESGADFEEHGNGSLEHNDHTGRFVRLITPRWALGETWFALSDTPMGPWVHATRVVEHERYTFYNPRHHRPLDADFGRRIHFDATYTTAFSGNDAPTPRYEYNQVLYRLDLDAPELAVPVPIYVSARGELGDHGVLEPGDAPLRAPFFAPVSPRPGTLAVAWSGPSCEARDLVISDAPPTPPLFYARPADASPGPHQVALYEVWPEDADAPRYTVEAEPGGVVVAWVWRNPIELALPAADYLPALRADAGDDRCLEAGAALSLAEGTWRLDGADVSDGASIAEGLHVLERDVQRADGLTRTDTAIVRVGAAPDLPPRPDPPAGGCGCRVPVGAPRGGPLALFLLALGAVRLAARGRHRA